MCHIQEALRSQARNAILQSKNSTVQIDVSDLCNEYELSGELAKAQVLCDFVKGFSLFGWCVSNHPSNVRPEEVLRHSGIVQLTKKSATHK